MCRGGEGGCRDDVRNYTTTKGTCPSPTRHGHSLQLAHQGLMVESCHLGYGKRGTYPHSLESVQTRGDRHYCADNSVARVSVIFLENCLGVSIIDWRGLFCGLKCLNAVQDPIEVLLHYRLCFGMALLDDILN